jgi:hypothetical protein
MQAGTAEVGAARRVLANRIGEAFELPSPHLFQVGPVRTSGRSFIKENGNIETPPDFEAGLPRQERALVELDARNGNEGNYVGRADAGVDAMLPGQIDQLGCLAGTAHSGLNHRGWISGNGDNGAIVVGIHGPIEQAHAFDAHCSHDGFDAARIRTF